jgi:LPS O-antigen subunit length determinant protein (WzzB/FepE family)
MRRIIIVASMAALLLVAFVPVQAQAANVYCRVPTAHKVVCYNFTPYRVFMNVTVHTSAGPRYFRFWNAYTKWVKYFSPVVYSVNWKWRF